MDAAALAARFPAQFLFGAATAAYQIEGAVDADGKGESIWDVFVRGPRAIKGGDTGEHACESYRRWHEDVELLAALGANAYRFEIAWPRVLPEGVGRIERRGLDHYERLVDALLAHGITPLPTLYHWSLPQVLEERGGWTNADAPAWFSEFVDAVLDRLADRVPAWLTINEPAVCGFLGYARGVHAPGRRGWENGLTAVHRLLAAHQAAAAVVRAARRPGGNRAQPASLPAAVGRAGGRRGGAPPRRAREPLVPRSGLPPRVSRRPARAVGPAPSRRARRRGEGLATAARLPRGQLLRATSRACSGGR